MVDPATDVPHLAIDFDGSRLRRGASDRVSQSRLQISLETFVTVQNQNPRLRRGERKRKRLLLCKSLPRLMHDLSALLFANFDCAISAAAINDINIFRQTFHASQTALDRAHTVECRHDDSQVERVTHLASVLSP